MKTENQIIDDFAKTIVKIKKNKVTVSNGNAIYSYYKKITTKQKILIGDFIMAFDINENSFSHLMNYLFIDLKSVTNYKEIRQTIIAFLAYCYIRQFSTNLNHIHIY